MGSANSPRPSEKDMRETDKKAGKTPDRPHAACGGSGALPAPKTKTSNLSSHLKTRKNAIKGIEPVMVQGFEGWAPEGFDSRPRATDSGMTMGEPAYGQGPSKRSLGTS